MRYGQVHSWSTWSEVTKHLDSIKWKTRYIVSPFSSHLVTTDILSFALGAAGRCAKPSQLHMGPFWRPWRMCRAIPLLSLTLAQRPVPHVSRLDIHLCYFGGVHGKNMGDVLVKIYLIRFRKRWGSAKFRDETYSTRLGSGNDWWHSVSKRM